MLRPNFDLYKTREYNEVDLLVSSDIKGSSNWPNTYYTVYRFLKVSENVIKDVVLDNVIGHKSSKRYNDFYYDGMWTFYNLLQFI